MKKGDFLALYLYLKHTSLIALYSANANPSSIETTTTFGVSALLRLPGILVSAHLHLFSNVQVAGSHSSAKAEYYQ